MASGDPPQQRPAATKDSPATSKGRRARTILIGVISVLAAVGIAYLAGRASLNAELRQARADIDAAKAAGREQAAGLEARVKELERRAQLLEARRELHRALLALDERNFGIAQKHLQLAGQGLQQAGGAAAPLGQELGRHKVVATEDIGAERGKLVGWAQAIDRDLL